MSWAVHNLATPAVEIDDHGTMTLDGQTRIALPEPLATFDTFDLAEEWREARLAEMKGEGNG